MCRLFNVADQLQRLFRTEILERINVFSELEKIVKEAVVVYLRVLSQTE